MSRARSEERAPATGRTAGGLALLLAASPAVAQETRVDSIGCEAAVERALADAPPVGRLLEAHARAQAEVLDTWPALELRGRTGYPLPIEAMRVGLRINLPRPGLGPAEAQAWRGRGGQASAEAAVSALDIALATREAHLAVRLARAELGWRQEALGFAQARLVSLRTQVAAGVETSLTLAREALAADALADDVAQARAELGLAAADLARFTQGAQADDQPCAPPLTPADLHPEVALARAGVERALGEGEALRKEGGFALDFVEVDWDQVEPQAGRLLFSAGLTLPTFADEGAAADAQATAARAALTAAERAIEAEVQRLRAQLAAADAHLAELDRPEPPELSVLAQVERLQPNNPDTLALKAALAERSRRRSEARFAREALLVQLAFALGR
jgi:hypothetical protein